MGYEQGHRKGLSERILKLIRPHLDAWTGRDSEFARYLMACYPERNVKFGTWANHVSRFRNFHMDEVPAIADEELDEETYVTDKAYYYNSETDVYVTFLRSAGGKPVTISGDTHRAMKEAYSAMVGDGATINEMTRAFQFPRAWFDEYRRLHGWTHDMDPFTDEEMFDTEVEDLVDELVLRNRRALHQTYEKRKWDDIRKEAEKWRNFEDQVLERFRNFDFKNLSKPKQLKLPEAKPYALVVSATDFHWGKYGWQDETGEAYDFDEAENRLFDKTSELISRLPGTPEKIVLAAGSDWFHIDTDKGTTTAGTDMGGSGLAGSPAEVLITGCQLARHHIELLRQVAPLEVVFMSGNHDRHSTLTLGLYLSAVYEDCEDVNVHLNAGTRHYECYGNTMLGFTHGDTVPQKKLPSLMAQEKWQEWGEHKFKVWFSGHYHHQAAIEDGGALCLLLPSLSGSDRWHSRRGYKSQAGLSGHIIDLEQGLIGSLFCPVMED